MKNKTWLATAPTPPFELDVTMADLLRQLDPGWQQSSAWYADSQVIETTPAAVAVA